MDTDEHIAVAVNATDADRVLMKSLVEMIQGADDVKPLIILPMLAAIIGMMMKGFMANGLTKGALMATVIANIERQLGEGPVFEGDEGYDGDGLNGMQTKGSA